MDSTFIEIIFTILGFLFAHFIPSFFENNLWDKNVPKTFEDFKKEYESDLDNILNDILYRFSNIFEDLITDKIDNKSDLSNNKKDSAEYSHILSQYKPFFIEIKKYIEIEKEYKHVESYYSRANNVTTTIKNNFYIIMGCIVCYIFLPGNFMFKILIVYGLYSLIFYLIFRSYVLFKEFKCIMKKIIDYKKWISDTRRNIVKLSDINEN